MAKSALNHYPHGVDLNPGDKLVIKDTYTGMLSNEDHYRINRTKVDHEYQCEVIDDGDGGIVRFTEANGKHVCDHHLYNVEIDIYKNRYQIVLIERNRQTELVFID